MENLTYLYGKPTATGQYKQHNSDFVVQEDLGYLPDGEGEHVFVEIRKEGYNTQFVAEQLAKFANIHPRNVSYAGLKDRNAVTQQWFGLHIPGKITPDFSQFKLDNCEVLSFKRHSKKLRIGNLKGNLFKLVIREIDKKQEVENKLSQIKISGVPNYFGEQRFGHDNNNLIQAEKWAKGEINVKDRKKRSFYLSAARSAIFNKIVSERINDNLFKTVLNGDILQLTGRGSWFVANQDELETLQNRVNQDELTITAPMIGDNELGTQLNALEYESNLVNEYGAHFIEFFKRERVATARRAMQLMPLNMIWSWQDDATLNLEFWLSAGSYATTVLREIII
ncbi:tRNA pseudouridine(13) synthase TruD [Orbaceae bacterium ac157xtp]